jgi:hypothetical protein
MYEQNDDYREVIKLLLARMDSHPEEFVGVSKRWHSLVQSYREFFTPAEMHAYNTKLGELHMATFHKEVLARLLNGADLKMAEAGQAMSQTMAAQIFNNTLQGQTIQKQSYGAVSGIVSGVLRGGS